jgi:hypothetical protein
MTEAEWLTCDDVVRLLRDMENRASVRKKGLYAYACVLRISHLIPEAERCRFLPLVQRVLSGMVSQEEVSSEVESCTAALRPFIERTRERGTLGETYRYAAGALDGSLTPGGRHDWIDVPHCAAMAAGFAALLPVDPPVVEIAWVDFLTMTPTFQGAYQAEGQAQVCLARDIFGNPFRPGAIDPVWLRWDSGAVMRLAQAIDDKQVFDRLPVLAEALEDAGCTDAAILDHCRGPGPHVRGCWVVDLILGKT